MKVEAIADHGRLTPDQPAKGRRLADRMGRWLRSREPWLFLLLLVCFAYFFPRWADWGQNSKLDLTLAIVDQGTFRIDDYYHNTGDYAHYKDHYYSDKAPGTAFSGVPFYAAFKVVLRTLLFERLLERIAANPAFASTLQEGGTGLLREKVIFAMALSVVTLGVVSVPSALLGLVLYRFLRRFTHHDGLSAFLVVVYGLATVAYPFSSILNGRQIVAVLSLSAFYLLYRYKRRELGPYILWGVGLLMGWAAITDYPSVLILGGIFLYAFFSAPKKPDLWRLIAAALPPGLLAAWYNYRCFETPLPVGYFYSELYADLHYQGFLSLTYPKLEALYGLTFSPFRGLFYLSPFLLLAVPGCWQMLKARESRPEGLVCLWAAFSFFWFNASSAMWWGGFSVGPAYLVPMVPYLMLPIACLAPVLLKRRWSTVLLGLLALWSWLMTWAQTIAGQSFPDLTPTPLVSIALPRLLAGDIARNWGMVLHLSSFASLLPLAVVAAGLGWLLASRRETQG